MRQIFIIPVICYFALLAEFSLFNLFGRWGDPHLLLLVVIFFNLYSGIRFSLWAALWAGLFKDCFSTMPFGTHIFVYIAAAYFSIFIRRTCYERGNDLSKLFMVSAIVTAHALIMGILHHMVFEEVRWWDIWSAVWFPEWVTSVAVALYFFRKLQLLARALRF